jgi:hypothetical protein
MIPKDITLENPDYAYMFGFLQTDGHLSKSTRNRGRLSVEVSKEDEAILWAFKNLLPFNSSITERRRNTNFTEDYPSVIWRVYDQEFRDYLESWGLFYGKKSDLIDLPNCKFSQADYFRGLIDGDGSLGLTSQGFPFISLVTSSSKIATGYLQLIKTITGKEKTSQRNKRDNVYNIAVFKEDAQLLVQFLYYENCLTLSRKLAKAKEVLSWVRPQTMKKIVNRKNWTKEENQYIFNHSLEDSMKMLNRSKKSIEIRLWRLKNISNK